MVPDGGDPELEELIAYIQESRGMDFRGYKRSSLGRRIGLRMREVGVEGFGAYQAFLEAHPREFFGLLDTILINITSFFRDPEAWETLRTEAIPAILARGEGKIRVWSAGCASGEEPYSVAMLLAEAMGIDGVPERVKIYATDLDEEALQAARLATYAPAQLASVPPALLERYFERSAQHYAFHRDLRRCVMFGRHNIVADAPISRIDLLHVPQHADLSRRRDAGIVLPRLHYALAEGGFLFLGKAETQLTRSNLFQPVDPGTASSPRRRAAGSG